VVRALHEVPLNLNVLLSAMLQYRSYSLRRMLLENRKDVEGGGGNCRSWTL
jgi:hypothetical protein